MGEINKTASELVDTMCMCMNSYGRPYQGIAAKSILKTSQELVRQLVKNNKILKSESVYSEVNINQLKQDATLNTNCKRLLASSDNVLELANTIQNLYKLFETYMKLDPNLLMESTSNYITNTLQEQQITDLLITGINVPSELRKNVLGTNDIYNLDTIKNYTENLINNIIHSTYYCVDMNGNNISFIKSNTDEILEYCELQLQETNTILLYKNFITNSQTRIIKVDNDENQWNNIFNQVEFDRTTLKGFNPDIDINGNAVGVNKKFLVNLFMRELVNNTGLLIGFNTTEKLAEISSKVLKFTNSENTKIDMINVIDLFDFNFLIGALQPNINTVFKYTGITEQEVNKYAQNIGMQQNVQILKINLIFILLTQALKNNTPTYYGYEELNITNIKED